jgi:heparosan-N-sulfate-glucuronate 5-epimerase
MAALTTEAETERTAVRGPGRAAGLVIQTKRAFWSMVGGSLDFSPQPLGRHIDPQRIAGYYSDLSGKTRLSLAEMKGTEYDWVIPLAQVALGYWERHLDGEDTGADFLETTAWLVERSEQTDVGLVWHCWPAVPKYGLSPGWISAMGQGQAISVLLRAHALTGEDRYLQLAEQAFGPLRLPVAEGGAQRELEGVTVLEEYPTTKPCAVLNGWIFALWGVHELSLVSEDPEPRQLFERSAAGVVELLPRYDNGWWSLYSLYDHGRPDLAKPFYQRLHPVMLEGLGLITGDERLRQYAERWRAQDTRLGVARAAADKLVFRAARALHARR